MPQTNFKNFLHKNGAWLGLFALCFIFLILTKGDFFSARNLTNLVRQASINGILACGMTLVIITGGIDLSIGSLVALAGMAVGVSQLNWDWMAAGALGAWGSVTASLVVGLGCGALTGALVAGLNIVPFVITLGMMVMARGAALIWSGGASLSPVSEDLGLLAGAYMPPVPSLILVLSGLAFLIYRQRQNIFDLLFPTATILGLGLSFFNYKGLPIIVVFVAITSGLTMFLLRLTVFGRSIYAVGSNPRASYWAGVNIKKTLFWVYAYMGLLAGLAGSLLTSRLNSADPNAGQLFELDAIAAVVIGGTSLKGGVGSVTGSLIGALMIATLNNGLDLLGVSSFYQMILKGVIIIGAVALDSSQRKSV